MLKAEPDDLRNLWGTGGVAGDTPLAQALVPVDWQGQGIYKTSIVSTAV